jgi:MFS transporter, AAHS family, 4-hydroxybenzoate transporter
MAKTTVSVENFIDEVPIGFTQVLVFAFCILVSVFDGFVTQAIAFVAPAISQQWGLTQTKLGFIFSGTLLGSVIGSTIFGSFADRYGRKNLIILATGWFAVFGGACAFAGNFHMLLAFRILGGIGMGGAIPNLLALTSEYAPKRKRTTIVTLALWGFPGGAVLGGAASSVLMTNFGWPAVFILGGVGPLLLVPAMMAWMPESLRFLALDPEKGQKAAELLRRIAPKKAADLILEPETHPWSQKNRGFRGLFAPDLIATTMLFSATMFCSLFVAYLLVNWIPTLLASAGMSVSHAIFGTVAINLGGIVGSYWISRMIDGHRRPLWVLAAGYAAAGIAILVVSYITGSLIFVLGMLTLCGFLLLGSQLSAIAFVADQFPVALRGTGIGVANAVGRMGSLIGPLLGGLLLSFGFSTKNLMALASLATLGAALSLVLLAGRNASTRVA